MLRRFACLLLAVLMAALVAGCHGGGGGGGGGGAIGDPSSDLPSGLQYERQNVGYTVGQEIEPNHPTSTGAAITHYAVSPPLPAGLSLATDTGIITGTPTAASLQTTYTVTGSNAYGSTETPVTITVTSADVQEKPVSLNYDVQNADYQAGVEIPPNSPHPMGGDISEYSVNPSLPAGLTMSTTTGVISGTPDAADAQTTGTFVVTGSNSAGSAQENLQIAIEPANVPPPSLPPPENLHYSASWAAYAKGEAIALNVAYHDGGEIVGYAVSPPLPAGMSLDSTTGDISGVPTATSPSTQYTITGEGVAGSGAAATTITLEVVPPGTWVPTAEPMHEVRYGAIQVTLPDGRVLVAGGQNAQGQVLASAELYDPNTGEWTEAAPMTSARYGAMGILLPSGDVLVAGGSGAGGVLTSAEIFDPSNPNSLAAWQSTGPMTSAHNGSSLAMMAGGNVVVAGGSSSTAAVRTVEVYNVGTGTWTLSKALNTAATGVSLLSMQGGAQIVVAGGLDSLSRAVAFGQVSSAPALSSWSNRNVAGPARAQYGSIAMNDNSALIFGGVNGPAQTAVDLYDASTSSFTGATPLSTPRAAPLVAPLDATHVLVAGGTAGLAGGVGIKTAEVYGFDPSQAPASSTADTATSPMSSVRIGGGISTLKDGHVLVSGGWDNTPTAPSVPSYWSTSELYIP
ncbi:putative Ig domain-containing protein [Trinickia dinghuensis]|nr:putative Ig domain-containing protein [Trinickia dinghuensis]